MASFHHCYFGWKLVLELQSFLYVPAHRFARLTGSSHPHTLRVLGSRGFYGRAYHGWLPAPCSGYANHPNRAIDGEGTRTPQTRQPCWLLRLPHSSIAVSSTSPGGRRDFASSNTARCLVAMNSAILPARSAPIPRSSAKSSPAASISAALRGKSSMVHVALRWRELETDWPPRFQADWRGGRRPS